MIKVDAMGDTCPIPVVKTKNAIKELGGSGEVQTLVDNEIAVQNLTKMANQKGYGVRSQKLGESQYEVIMTISVDGEAPQATRRSRGKNGLLSGCTKEKYRSCIIIIDYGKRR